MTATAPVFRRGKAWAVTITQILGSVGFGLGMYKAMTTMTLMITYFQIDFTTYGSITGIVALFSLITAIPGGIIMGKIGAKKLALLCLGLGCLGNVLPTIYVLIAARSTDFVLMTLLGIPGMLGWGAMSVAGTMLISAWFPPQKRSLPMGCAGLFVPLSLCMVLFLSTPLIGMASTEGFTAEELAMCYGQSPAGIIPVMVCFTSYIVIITIVAFLVIDLPGPENNFLGLNAATEHSGQQGQAFDAGKTADGFKNIGVWLMVLIFCCYTWGSMSFANYWPTYVEADPSMGGFMIEPSVANMMSQAVTFSMIAVSLVVGFLLTKIKRDYWWILVLLVTCMICFNNIFLFQIPFAGMIVPLLVVYGCTQELWPCITYTLIPELVDSPKALGAALGLVSFCMNAIGTVANTVNGIIIDNNVYAGAGTWHSLATPLTVCAIGALVLGICMVFVWRKRWAHLKTQAEEFQNAAA